MSVAIKYNGVNPFGTRTPFASIEYFPQDTNEYPAGAKRVTLTGTRPRPACNTNFAAYKSDMEFLKSYFRDQFKSLEITETVSGTKQLFYHPSAKILSVSFPESSFSGFYTYEIIFDCIGTALGEVADIVDEFSRSETDDGTITTTHTVSARGVGPNAFEKARNYVLTLNQLSLLGSDLLQYPKTSRKTFVNRLTGEFRMTETWVNNPLSPGANFHVITYETSISDDAGEAVVTISGDIQVNRIDAAAGTIATAKTTFDTIDFQAIAQADYTSYGGTTQLSSVRSFNVSENPDLGSVSFSMSWGSLSKSSPYILETSTISHDHLTGKVCMKYSGTVKSDYGCAGSRYATNLLFFKSLNWETRIASSWSKYGNGEPLSPSAESQSISHNTMTGEISFSRTYCVSPQLLCGALEDLKYQMSWKPSIQMYVPNPILDGRGFYNIQDLGFKNRKTFTVTGSARRKSCFELGAAKSEIRSRINLLMNKYFPGRGRVLLNSSTEELKGGNVISFTFEWSAEAD